MKMKNIILFMVAVIFTATTFGQVATAPSGADYEVTDKAYSDQFLGSVKDTVTTVDTFFMVRVNVGKLGAKTFYDFKVKVKEKTAALGSNYITLLGRKFSEDTWTTISTVKYFGSGTDTTVLFTQNSTATSYNTYAIAIGRKTGVSKVYPEYIKYFIKK